jgi:hypothetical protein
MLPVVWKEKARKTLSEIVAALRSEDPDCQSMMSKVRALNREIGRQNIFGRVEPGALRKTVDLKVAEFRDELEHLDSALSEDDVAKALEHAKAALQTVE